MVVWSLSYPISTMMIEIFARKGLSRRIYQLVPPKYQMFKHLWRYLYLFRPHSLNHEWLPWINHNLSSLPRNGWMLSLLIEKGIVLAKDIQSQCSPLRWSRFYTTNSCMRDKRTFWMTFVICIYKRNRDRKPTDFLLIVSWTPTPYQ